MSTGRSPNVDGLNLDAAGIEYDATSGIRINDFLQTSNRSIYATGDVCREHKFAHIEGASAHIVTQNALFRGRQRLSALTVPWCTFTDPEIAHVGMYLTEARDRNIPVKTITVLMHEVDRAIADAEEDGFVKIHVRDGTDQILGATVVARTRRRDDQRFVAGDDCRDRPDGIIPGESSLSDAGSRHKNG